VFKRTVTDFYVQKTTVPTCRKHLPIIKDKIIFHGRVQSLSILLHKWMQMAKTSIH